MKFVVNGSNFNYGKVLVYYTPMRAFDLFSNVHYAIDRDQNLVSYSQRPNIMLDACGAHGGTLTMPFIYPQDSISIPTGDWGNLGTIGLKTFTQLKHANGGTDPIEIHSIIWATDVTLIGSTSQPPANLVPQSGSEYNGMCLARRSSSKKWLGCWKKLPS